MEKYSIKIPASAANSSVSLTSESTISLLWSKGDPQELDEFDTNLHNRQSLVTHHCAVVTADDADSGARNEDLVSAETDVETQRFLQ